MDQQNTPERPAEIDDAQLSLGAWATRNGPVVLLMAGLIGYLWYKMGAQGMGNILLVVLGLGLVIFIHELGHFAVAKWCDVHVQTFSIGFGPALPGCSFQWGETTYKVALLPLGGYVKMVGEGEEGTEEDADPRSFKNKTVGQRMAIISAGVVMNVLLGVGCFIWAFGSGVHQTAPVISVVEAGGPAWVKGVRTGDVVERVADTPNPFFEDLKITVMLSGEGEAVPFVFRAPGGSPRTVNIVPRKGRGESNPVIGVRWPGELKAPEQRDFDDVPGPARRGSAAAAARVLPLRPGDELLASTSPDGGDALKPLGANDFAELARRARRLTGKPMAVRVRRDGAEHLVEAGPGGFDFEDRIVGMTDGASDTPFAVTEIPADPRDPQGRHRDIFEYQRRMKALAGRPVVVRVRRKGGEADVFVPPAYHRVLPGMRMEMGPVFGVREDSPAETSGVRAKDVLARVTLSDGKERVTYAVHPDAKAGERTLDPIRLPDDLRGWAAGRKDVTATLTVRRAQDKEENKEQVLPPARWQEDWRFDEELPLGPSAPLPIPELGLAYQVKATAEDVAAGSQAAQRGLREGDAILAANFLKPPRKEGDVETWHDKPPLDLRPRGDSSPDPLPRWANVFYNLQQQEIPKVKLLVRRAADQGGAESEIELDLVEDDSWPLHDPLAARGLQLMPVQDRIAQADSLFGAVRMGMRHTARTIGQIYLSLRSLLTGRVSATENLQGPIDIAVIAYRTAERDWSDFVLLIGIISVNLAVVNFLPIPVLDGGHMVFLLYEKMRGRPASEAVRLAATWVGVVLLVSLMVFAFYLGFKRHVF